MSNRRYARTARLNELFREILGDELERVDDDRLEMVTVTGVDVDAGLDHAVVYFSSLAGPEGDEDVLEGLEEARRGLQSAVARQTRLRATPRLVFRPDEGIRTGQRVDEILRELHERGELDDERPALGEGVDDPDRTDSSDADAED